MSEIPLERMVLQFMGAYTELQDSMQFHVYSHLRDEERAAFNKRTPDNKIFDNFKKLCNRTLNVAVPSLIPDTYKGTARFRNDLAHLLEIESINGEEPNRAMTFIRYADYTTAGDWARQNKRRIEITESELRFWTDDLRIARNFINIIMRLAAINEEFNHSDDHVMDVDWIPWWDGRWGKMPEYGEVCRAPIGRYRASTKPSTYWLADRTKWETPQPLDIIPGRRD